MGEESTLPRLISPQSYTLTLGHKSPTKQLHKLIERDSCGTTPLHIYL